MSGEGRGGGGLYDEDETTEEEEEEEEEEEDEDERGVRKTAGLAEVRLCTILIQLLYMCSVCYRYETFNTHAHTAVWV